MTEPICVADFRERARTRLPRFLFDYADGGANAEATLRANVTDLEAVTLRQRVLAGSDDVDISTELFGYKWALPLALAPIGLAGMYARRGERQAARAARTAGVPFALSTVSVCDIEEVASSSGLFWFQLYMIRDRGLMRALLERAKRAGCSVLVFTVDMPLAGIRYRDYRSGLAGAPGLRGSVRRFAQAAMHPRWAWNVGVRGRPHHLGNIAPMLNGGTGLEDFFAWMGDNFDPSVSWKDLEAVRADWNGTLIVKGVLDVDDARAVAAIQADGIIVSNHGGRQLDGAPSTARALPAIADAVGDAVTVLVDGGIRSGVDILRMLALGAKGVLLGRAWVYALAAGGEAGMFHMLQRMETEMRAAMVLTGNRSIAQISRDTLAD